MRRHAVAMLALSACLGVGAWAQPSIQFESTVERLGIAHTSSSIPDAIFRFRNVGDEVLVLSCGGCGNECKLDKETVQPGETGVVTAPGRRVSRGPTEGVRWSTPRVRTNDPDNAEVFLRAEVDWRPWMWVDAQLVWLDPVAKHTRATMSIPVYSRGADLERMHVWAETESTLAGERIELDIEVGPAVKLQWSRTGEQVVRRVVSLSMPPGLDPGQHRFWLHIEAPVNSEGTTGSSQPAPLRVHASFKQLGDLAYEWSRSEPSAAPGSLVDRVVEIRSRSGEPFRVLGVRARDTPPGRVELTEFESSVPTGSASATEHTVLVTLHAPREEGVGFGRQFEILTDVEQEESLLLVVRGTTAGGA